MARMTAALFARFLFARLSIRAQILAGEWVPQGCRAVGDRRAPSGR